MARQAGAAHVRGRRVARAWDASGDAEEVAATFGVSRAWVHRLVQRRRETGSIEPRQQTKYRSRVLAGQEDRLAALITAKPDVTLAELRAAMPTTAALSTLWREIDRLGLTVKKNRTRRRTATAGRRRRASTTIWWSRKAAANMGKPISTWSGSESSRGLRCSGHNFWPLPIILLP